MLRIGILFPILIAIAAPRALATPLEVGHLPADTHAVIHVDVDALRKTSFYTPLMAALPAKSDPELAKLITPILAECQAVTVWGTNTDDDEGAVIAQFPPGSRHPVELVDLVVKIAHGKDLGGRRFAIKTDKSHFELMQVDNLVVAAQPASMKKAIAVLHGKEPAMSVKALPGGAAPSGAFVFIALDANVLNKIKQAASSAVLKADIQTLVVSFAEVGSNFTANASAAMSTADDAVKVKSVLDGLIALGELSDEVKAAVGPIGDYLKVSAAGTKLAVQLTVPTAKLLELVKKVDNE